MMKMESDGMHIIAKNKKAFHDYFIEKKYEAGIALKGTEVKSIRAGRIALKDSYCDFRHGELYLMNCHISPYEFGNINNVDPLRDRKLLMHRSELRKLEQEIKEKGYTIVPLSIYFKGDKLKLEIGLAKGKKLYDKRHTEAQKTAQREIERGLRDRQKGAW